jgi:hypothetical protein
LLLRQTRNCRPGRADGSPQAEELTASHEQSQEEKETEIDLQNERGSVQTEEEIEGMRFEIADIENQ